MLKYKNDEDEKEYMLRRNRAIELANQIDSGTFEFNNFSDNNEINEDSSSDFDINDTYQSRKNKAVELAAQIDEMNGIYNPTNEYEKKENNLLDNTLDNTLDNNININSTNNSSSSLKTYNSDKSDEQSSNNKIFKSGAFEDGYQLGDVTKTIAGTLVDTEANLSKGVFSVVENVLDVGANIIATFQDILGFDDSAKKVREWANLNTSDLSVNYLINKSTLGKLFYMENAVKNGTSLEEVKQNYNNLSVSELANNKYYEDNSVLGEYADQTVNLVGYTAGLALGSWALGGASSVSVNIGKHTIELPTLAIAGGTAGKLQEVNSKGDNVTELERWSAAISGGLIEGTTEGIWGALGVGGSDITNKFIKNATSRVSSSAGKMLVQLGIQATGEATEEFLSYAGNYLADNLLINNLGSTDFSSEWDWKEVGEQIALAFVSSAITAGGGNMINNNAAIQSAEKQLGRKLNQVEKAEVTQAVINAATEEKKAIKFDPEGMGENVGTFYTTTVNQNGEIDSIVETTGKIIENPNKKVNVSPVIVRNNENNAYNIIDGNTGALLDSSEYETLIEAKAEFSSKMINLDENSIQEINNAVAERNIALQDKTKETAIELSNILTSHNVQETNSGNLTSNTTNNISQEINSNTSQNDSNFYNPATKYVVNGAEEFINRFNDKKTYTEEQISNIVDEGYDNIVSYDDKGDIESYIDFETEGNTLQISLRDGNTDEIIKATGIEANKNGRYSAEEIRDSIRNITIDNENRPIKGQQDIEGNEVRSMRKRQNNKKYDNITDLLNDKQQEANENFQSKVDILKIKEIEDIDFNKISTNEYIKKSKEVFRKYNTKRTFINNSSNLKIKVILDDIKESAYKAYNSKYQSKYLKEHLEVLANIEDVIKNSDENSISNENKGRKENKDWKYFTVQSNIENEPFLIEFDAVNKEDGYHFRLQRIVKLNIKNRDITSAMTNKTVDADSR